MPGVSKDRLNVQADRNSLLIEGDAVIDMPAGMEALYADAQATIRTRPAGYPAARSVATRPPCRLESPGVKRSRARALSTGSLAATANARSLVGGETGGFTIGAQRS